ncbi:MAG TPA: formate dehydrogenase accessory sulfurtransferase FdhD [Thermoanaerobaculia bacterium]|nr:formate dehydrogenase accessory sulfurtransferase FdhD [Thermoanaerobaculia bacterium]
MSDKLIASVGVTRVTRASAIRDEDVLAVEEPLEIRAAWSPAEEPREKSIAVTMRTPGHDADLACGFLFTEGLIRSAGDIESVRHWGSPNVIRIALRSGVKLDAGKLERHFYTTSSCGVCGKTSIEALRVITSCATAAMQPIDADLIHRLPQVLQEQQIAFRATGGLHGAAIVDAGGALLRIREDIGRHNAVDKVIGSLFREGMSPPPGATLMVSSRASFELVQKAVVAGIQVLAAVGAPSTLAVELAREFNVTLLGFVRDGRFNVYNGEVR